MRAFTRQIAPDFILEKWLYWGNMFAENRGKNPAFRFQWPTHNGTRINILIQDLLARQTDDHCSYCDNFPIREKEGSIDHFRPKSRHEFYSLVCQWENLFYCCHNCQQYKLEQFEEILLKPDSDEYSFDKYFVYSYDTHEIAIQPALEPEDQQRALYTLSTFGFNDSGNVASRRITWERYIDATKAERDIILNDYPFRFILY